MTDLSASNNNLLKGIGKTLQKDTNLTSVLGADKATQAENLKKIFTEISSNDVSASEKEALMSTAQKIQEKLEVLEGKLLDLEEKIAKKEKDINEKAEEITKLITQIDSKNKEVENDYHDAVKNEIDKVFDRYKSGDIKKDEISSEINIAIAGLSTKTNGQLEVKSLMTRLSNNKEEVNRLSNMAAGWIDSKNLLEREFGVTKSTYLLLNKTIQQVGNTGTSYVNSNTNTTKPVYSLEKLDVISDLFANTNFNKASTNTNYGEAALNTKESITEKYSKYFAAENVNVSGDVYSDANPSFQKLDDAIKAGMLDDLKNSNMTNKEIVQFIADNYKGAKISFDSKTNQLTIPWGHGDKASVANINK